MTATVGREKAANLWPYVGQFTLVYFAVSIAMGAVLYFLEVDTNTGIGIALLVAAVVLPVRQFVLDYRRPFGRGEQLRFAFLTFAASLLVSLTLLALAAAYVVWIDGSAPSMDELSAIVRDNILLIALVSLITCLISFVVLYFISGFFSRSFAKRLTDKGKI